MRHLRKFNEKLETEGEKIFDLLYRIMDALDKNKEWVSFFEREFKSIVKYSPNSFHGEMEVVEIIKEGGDRFKKLMEIIDFGNKIIDDISDDNNEMIESIKLILQDIEDRCDDFVDGFQIVLVDDHNGVPNEDKYRNLKLKANCILSMSRKNMISRKNSKGYAFTSDEVINFWPHIISSMEHLVSLGLECRITSLSTNVTQLIIYIERNNI